MMNSGVSSFLRRFSFSLAFLLIIVSIPLDGLAAGNEYGNIEDGNVIEQKPGEPKPNVPSNFVKIEFDDGGNSTFVDGPSSIYWVNPDVKVIINTPRIDANDNFKHFGWTYLNEEKKRVRFYKLDYVVETFRIDTKIKPECLKKIIEGYTPDKQNYRSVEFIADEQDPARGQLKGNAKFWVLKDTIIDLVEPVVAAEPSYKFVGWDKKIENTYSKNTIYTATYEEQPLVLTEEPEDLDYIKITFETGIGQFEDSANNVVFWVLKNAVKYSDLALKVKDPVGNDGWTFEGWHVPIDEVFTENTTITATYKKGLESVKPIPNVRIEPMDQTITEGNEIKIITITPEDNNSTIYIDPNDLPNGLVFEDNNILGTPVIENWEDETGIIFKILVKIINSDGFTITEEINITVNKKVESNLEPEQPEPPVEPEEPEVEQPELPLVPEEPEPQRPQENYRPVYPLLPNRQVPRRLDFARETQTQENKSPIFRKEEPFMQGYNGKFRPDDRLARAEAVQIIANILKQKGYDTKQNQTVVYSDLIDKEWYTEAIRITTETGIFRGYYGGQFKPDTEISRAEWIVALTRLQNFLDNSSDDPILETGHWAKSQIESASKRGWLKIYTDKLVDFVADEPITRKEVAAISNKALGRVQDREYIRNNDKTLNKFKDIHRDMWAYEDIIIASNAFVRQSDKIYVVYE